MSYHLLRVRHNLRTKHSKEEILIMTSDLRGFQNLGGLHLLGLIVEAVGIGDEFEWKLSGLQVR